MSPTAFNVFAKYSNKRYKEISCLGYMDKCALKERRSREKTEDYKTPHTHKRAGPRPITQPGTHQGKLLLPICGNKMPTRCKRGFYCRSYCLLNMFRASPCSSSGAQEYYTVVAACGILCCGFSSSWSGVELRVMRPVCRMLVYW